MQPLQLPTTPIRLCCCRSESSLRLEESTGSIGRLSSLEAGVLDSFMFLLNAAVLILLYSLGLRASLPVLP